MCRIVPASIAVLVAFCPIYAENPTPAALRKSMPADQTTVMKNIDELNRLNKQAEKEHNALRLKQLAADGKVKFDAVVADLAKKVKEDGLTNWVGVIDTKYGGHISLGIPGLYRVDILHANLTDEQTKLIAGLKNGDRVKFTIPANPNYTHLPKWSDDGLVLEYDGGRPMGNSPDLSLAKIERLPGR